MVSLGQLGTTVFADNPDFLGLTPITPIVLVSRYEKNQNTAVCFKTATTDSSAVQDELTRKDGFVLRCFLVSFGWVRTARTDQSDVPYSIFRSPLICSAGRRIEFGGSPVEEPGKDSGKSAFDSITKRSTSDDCRLRTPASAIGVRTRTVGHCSSVVYS